MLDGGDHAVSGDLLLFETGGELAEKACEGSAVAGPPGRAASVASRSALA